MLRSILCVRLVCCIKGQRTHRISRSGGRLSQYRQEGRAEIRKGLDDKVISFGPPGMWRSATKWAESPPTWNVQASPAPSAALSTRVAMQKSLQKQKHY